MFNHTLLMQLMLVAMKNTSDVSTEVSNKLKSTEQASSEQTLALPLTAKPGSEVCYGEFGCFSLRDPWINAIRPVVEVPHSPEKINTGFCLYTRRNTKHCQRLIYNHPESITKSELMSVHRTYIIVHGFLENGQKSWMQYLKDRLLEKSDCNVILVDWAAGANPPYAQAVANVRVTGTVIAHFLVFLNKLSGLQTAYCHVIGHSLGAHIAGQIGSTLKTRFGLDLGRISGLDPAQPHFTETDPIVRLDPTDALFVDIVHTDASPFATGGLGILAPIGHLDFYPNGGYEQPGCDQSYDEVMQEEGNHFNAARKIVGCNHERSYQVYIESVTLPCRNLAIQCDSWESFQAGKCFKCRNELHPDGFVCASMGFPSVHTVLKDVAERGKALPSPDFKLVKLYTITGSTAQYCRSLYRITLEISNSTESNNHNGESGEFSMTLDGIMNKSPEIIPFKKRYYRPGEKLRTVVGSQQVGVIRTVALTFTHHVDLYNPITWRFSISKIHVHRITIDNLEEDYSMSFCPVETEILMSKIPSTFRPCSDRNEIIN